MNINGGFFSDTENDALKEMRKMVGCDVKRCVFPTIGNLTYYISEHGDLFSIQMIQARCVVRGPKKPGSLEARGKRRDGGITHRLSYAPRKERWIPCELLVYCTFVLGRWEPDLKILFKNGNASDIRPDNMEVPPTELPTEWSKRMTEYKEMYQRDFNRVVQSVRWWCGIPVEDAKDVASNTFIWLCTEGFKNVVNPAIWTYWSRKRGFDFVYHSDKMRNGECFDCEIEIRGTTDQTPEIDLFHIQKGARRSRFLELWAQGHTPTEIAEMEGTNTSNVGSSVTRSIQFLRKYFKHEKEYLRT